MLGLSQSVVLPFTALWHHSTPYARCQHTAVIERSHRCRWSNCLPLTENEKVTSGQIFNWFLRRSKEDFPFRNKLKNNQFSIGSWLQLPSPDVAEILANTIDDLNFNTIWLWPNVDAGTDKISKILRKCWKLLSFLRYCCSTKFLTTFCWLKVPPLLKIWVIELYVSTEPIP